MSAHKVQSILITTAAHLSTDAIELAAQHNIDLTFLDRRGDPYARVWQTKMGSTAAIRRRQLEVAEGPDGLALVQEWVQARVNAPKRIGWARCGDANAGQSWRRCLT